MRLCWYCRERLLALDLADRVYLLDHGRVVYEGVPDQLEADEEHRERRSGESPAETTNLPVSYFN